MFVISCAGVYCDASMWFSSWQLICLVYMHEKHIWTLVILPSPIIPGGETDSICRRQHHMTVELDTRFVRPRWVVISKDWSVVCVTEAVTAVWHYSRLCEAWGSETETLAGKQPIRNTLCLLWGRGLGKRACIFFLFYLYSFWVVVVLAGSVKGF